MNNVEAFFFDEVLKQEMIGGFPYPEMLCRVCGSEMRLARVAHMQENPEHYKALYLCVNDSCDAYDVGKKAYTKMYFSSELAYEKLGFLMMALPRREVK
jgi:hypothetical protein